MEKRNLPVMRCASPHLSCFSPQARFPCEHSTASCQALCGLLPGLQRPLVPQALCGWRSRPLHVELPRLPPMPQSLLAQLPQLSPLGSVPAPLLLPLLSVAYYLKHSYVSSGLNSYAYSASMRGFCSCSLHRSELVLLLLP